MVFPRHPENCRTNGGLSIIELLVSVAVIGIAIGGITELVWLNATWFTKSFNKVDNYYAAQLFLQRIGRDIRMARGVQSSLVPGAVDGIALTISKSSLSYDASFATLNANPTNALPINGFPYDSLGPAANQALYQLIADPSNPGQYQMWYYPTQYENSAATVVLSGIIGPSLVGSPTPKIFQFVSSNNVEGDPLTGIQNSAPSDAGSVIVNLELKRNTYGYSNASEASTTSPSQFAMRSEFALKNVTSGD